ncbi:hypothetical protein [Mesorhizobium sp. AR07]|uniref:hypothetical protein n=1 Tax=Mesorhizobium sp. AR07 TaxID=2865838 RepID=UPI00215F959F|nr:hypothetical protein [Mesorhizobium sp. AR07]
MSGVTAGCLTGSGKGFGGGFVASGAGWEGCVGGVGLAAFAGSGLVGCGFGTSATFIAAGSRSNALPTTLVPD